MHDRWPLRRVTDYNGSKAGYEFAGNMWDDGLLFANDTTYPYGWFYN